PALYPLRTNLCCKGSPSPEITAATHSSIIPVVANDPQPTTCGQIAITGISFDLPLNSLVNPAPLASLVKLGLVPPARSPWPWQYTITGNSAVGFFRYASGKYTNAAPRATSWTGEG